MLLLDILSDLLKIEDVLFIIKNAAAVSEIQGHSLEIKQKEKWITVGSNDGPAHMHINSELIQTGEFIEEKKLIRTSFSVQFFDQNKERILGVFFTKMYDVNDNLNFDRKKIYEKLCEKYGSKLKF